MVNEAYKDGSGGEHGIYQTYKLALYRHASRNSQAHTITGKRTFSDHRALTAASRPATTRPEDTQKRWGTQRQTPSL